MWSWARTSSRINTLIKNLIKNQDLEKDLIEILIEIPNEDFFLIEGHIHAMPLIAVVTTVDLLMRFLLFDIGEYKENSSRAPERTRRRRVGKGGNGSGGGEVPGTTTSRCLGGCQKEDDT